MDSGAWSGRGQWHRREGRESGESGHREDKEDAIMKHTRTNLVAAIICAASPVMAAIPIDPDAAAYAERVGLEREQMLRLSGFLSEIREVSITPAWLVLGRKEFKALDGVTHRAVIGPDGELTGTFTAEEPGLVFAGAGEVYEADNPLKGDSIPELSFIANAIPAVPGRRAALLSSYENARRGPALALGAAVGQSAFPDNRFMGFSGTSDGSSPLIGRTTANVASIAGHSRLMGGFWSASLSGVNSDHGRVLSTMSGLNLRNISSGTPPQPIWNDNEKIRIGQNLDGTDSLQGTVDFAMAAAHPISREQWLTLMNAVKKHGIITTPNPHVMWSIGDSMTAGRIGTRVFESRSEQLVWQESGWQGIIHDYKAQGGRGISVQEQLFAKAMAEAEMLHSWGRWIMFWAGYNLEAGVDLRVRADRESLADRYVAMAETAARNGVNTIHWRSLITGKYNPADDADNIAGVDAFNACYAARLESLQARYPNVRILWYDHQLTFDNNEFDTSEQRADFMAAPGDTRHLGPLGQSALVADFIARFPGPDHVMTHGAEPDVAEPRQ